MTHAHGAQLPRIPFRDPGSAITHLIAFIAAAIATPPLLERAARLGCGPAVRMSLTVFMVSMMLLYAASTTYHSLDLGPRRNKLLRKVDHMMISVLIAGTYTPVCVVTLRSAGGTQMLALIWALAALGILIKLFWVTCPKWFSSVIYIGMGWACVLVMPQLVALLSRPAFLWLLAGGLMYTVGGVIYALKLKVFNERFPNFGSHEVFHLFVMAGSFCHYVFMYQYLLTA